MERIFKLRVWNKGTSVLVFEHTFSTKETERELHERINNKFSEKAYDWTCEQMA